MDKEKNKTTATLRNKNGAKPAKTPKKTSVTNIAPEKLVLLVTIVNREKGEYYLDLIQAFKCNFQLSANALGTAQKALGLLTPDTEKTVLFSVLTRPNAKAALEVLEKKFSTIRNGKGVAFTVPLTSTVGVLIYRFLSNKE